MYTLWINGYHATRIGPHDAPTYELNAEGGCGELKVTFGVPVGFEHQALQRGKSVRLTLGSWGLYWGYVVDYNRETGELVAGGEFGREKLALDGSNNATLDLGVAITSALARGWDVSNPSGVGGVATGELSGVLTIAELAKRVADETGTFIGINGRGEFYKIAPPAPPTQPKWLLAPGSVALAPTTEGMADYLAVRFFDGSNNVSVLIGSSGEERGVDLTDRGTLTDVQAAAIASAMNGKLGSRLAWAGGFEVPNSHIMTRGGTPAALANVTPLSMARIPGLPVLSAGALWLDEVIGKTRYTVGAEAIYLEPLSSAPRTLADVIAAS